MGRLDKASEGLLLLTNDSEWAARITDPASHLDKVYHVQMDRVADEELLAKVREGCATDVEGERLRCQGSDAFAVRRQEQLARDHMDEGKNRQIRRLLEGLEVKVLRLVRMSIGPLELGDLKKGQRGR